VLRLQEETKEVSIASDRMAVRPERLGIRGQMKFFCKTTLRYKKGDENRGADLVR